MSAKPIAGPPPFRELRFGLADAEQEGVTEPDLLLAGYLDLHGVSEAILQGHHYVVLGYKGSGKSAVSQHLRLRSSTLADLFVKVAYLADFPYADFLSMVPGSADSDSRMPTGWSWILLCYLLDSFSADEGAAARDTEFENTIQQLRTVGIIPNSSLPHLVRESVTKTLKLTLPKIVEYTHETTGGAQDLQVPLLIDRLTSIACRFSSDSEHVLVLDGLDDVFVGSALQYKTLAALILAISRLNRCFQQNDTPAKVVLLCRTDMFERLPGPNKNKVRQDSAIHLDWYHHTRAPGESHLIQLANRKARVSHPNLPDIFETYFPQKLKGRPIHKYLLDYTRHTPRDFLQLLRRLQEFSTGSRRLSTEDILSGIRWYSTDYFLPEIKDELVGHASGEEIDGLLALLSTMKHTNFHFEDLKELALNDGRFKDVHLERGLNLLFDCSAVGTVDRADPNSPFFTFRYRNRHSTMKFDETIRVHQALWAALNLTKDFSDRARGSIGLPA